MKDFFCKENGASQGQNLAFTVVFAPNSQDSGDSIEFEPPPLRAAIGLYVQLVALDTLREFIAASTTAPVGPSRRVNSCTDTGVPRS